MVNALRDTRARTERVIALGRVVLAGFSLLAIWLDPPAPSKHADITHALVTVYLGYALILAAWVWHAVTTVERGVMVVHVLDILAFTLLMYFTEGVTSPFFVYFVFAVIAGALRWLWRGALWTGLAVLAIFLSMGLYFHYGRADAEIAGHLFIIRGVYLGVVAVLLAYMTAYEQRLRTELASLAARKAVEFQASLLDAVEQAVVATDGEGRVRYWNRFAEQLYGWRSAEVTGRSLREVITFIQGDGQRLDVPGQCLTGVSWSGEVEAVRRDGSRFPAYLVCSRLTGDAQGYVSLSMDITASKQAREALWESENKYGNLVENSPTGVFILQDGRFVFVNPRFAELLDYSREELLRLDPWVVVYPDDRDGFSEIARRQQEGERLAGEYECRLVTRIGQVRWVAMRNTLIRHRAAVATLGNVQDVTERKHMETDLHQLSARLLGIQEEERRRVARDLHDSLGQTLTGIKFTVEAALGELWPQERRSGIERLRALIPTIQDAVEEVRRIATELRPSILDDLGLLATIAWYLREFEKTHPRLAVEHQIAATEADVPRGLRTPIFRILQEATNNAAKHSDASRLEVMLEVAAGRLRLRVRDDGVGFDPAVPRAEPGTGGSGLGSMRERTELSGGCFSVTSGSGAGTTIQAEWRLG